MSAFAHYWMHETGDVLRPAIEAYLHGEPMTVMQIAAVRAYLRQWIAVDTWRDDDGIIRRIYSGPPVRLAELRGRIEGLTNRDAITAWLDDAEALGIDPL